MIRKDAYNKLVGLKYELYNGLFLTLPFPHLEEIGIKLPIFAEHCKHALEQGDHPPNILKHFFSHVIPTSDFNQKMKVLFLFSQFIERQIVLFDALEQAAFTETRAGEHSESLTYLIRLLKEKSFKENLSGILKNYRTRIVLTAHPTQFYPPVVLQIIDKLAHAVKNNNLPLIEEVLLQLGMTSFRNLNPPTPLSEGQTLLDRSHNIFFEAITSLEKQLIDGLNSSPIPLPFIELGFWPGGDRDGNPFVNIETTKKIAEDLKKTALLHYKKELRQLKEKLTFPGMGEIVNAIEKNLDSYSTPEDLLEAINHLHETNSKKYRGLFNEEIERLHLTVETFGFHFASLDLRQDSSAHQMALETLFKHNYDWPEECAKYNTLSNEQKTSLLEKLCSTKIPPLSIDDFSEDPILQDLIACLLAVNPIQKSNGEKGLHRYITSNTQGAHNLLEICFVMHILQLDDLKLDLVPLFETVEDLKHSGEVMQRLYDSPIYSKHLKKRGNRQTVMVGFSDGTKDGGYLTCNWEIFKAKQHLEKLSQNYNVDVIFFDGRGGPPARGGGNTHKFYRALGANLKQQEVQLTIQGQTISSKFGSKEAARFNIEQLFTAGLEAHLFSNDDIPLSKNDIELLDELSAASFESYSELRNAPLFLPFLEEITPIQYYQKLNVASRPTKRGKAQELALSDLRAIPFVSAWSQIKLNIPGFYGLGTALRRAFDSGKGEKIKNLYCNQLFFSTLINNAMMALAKSNPLFTAHLLSHQKYGAFIQQLHNEAELTKQLLLEVSQQKELMENDPINGHSIKLREKLTLPLLVIQQYAMEELKNTTDQKEQEGYEKLLLKTVPAIINASRNSA